MSDSILTSIKKQLGLDPSYTVFDQDVMLLINSGFSDLRQLGVGPIEGFSIPDDSATWAAFLGEDLPRYMNVKEYVYLKVRIIFDPPQGTTLDAFKARILELETRINIERETYGALTGTNAEFVVSDTAPPDPVEGEFWIQPAQ